MFELDKKYNNWNSKRILRHVTYWGFWLTFYCVLNGSLYGSNYLDWLLFEALAMTVKLPFVYFVAYALLPRFLPQKAYLHLAFSMFFSALVASFFTTLIYRYFPYEMGKDLNMTFGKYIYRILDLLYIASFVVIIKIVQEYSRQKAENTELIQDKMQSELKMLKNQLQPHFLFNTLNNIYSLVISEDQKASGAIIKLSDILSYMLYECNAEKVPIEKEIKLIQNYIELEKIRYGARLELSFSVDGDILGQQVPPLLLIPFIENAFKHGIAKHGGNSWLRVHIDISDAVLKFLVENEYSQAQEPSASDLKSGIGIQNIKKRLNLLYPEKHKLQIIKQESYLIKLQIEL